MSRPLNRRPVPASAGTTLVEVMVVLTIIAILAGVVWRLMMIGHATFDEGIWRNEREQEVKIGFRQLQEDVKSLAGLSATHGTALVFNKTDGFDFLYDQAAVGEAGCASGKVMTFYSCRQPLKVGLGNAKLEQPAIVERVLYEINAKRELVYSRWRGEIKAADYKDEASIGKIATLDPGSLSLEPVDKERVLMHDVECVKLRPFGKETELKRRKPIILQVEMKHITRRKRELAPLVKEVLLELNAEPRTL